MDNADIHGDVLVFVGRYEHQYRINSGKNKGHRYYVPVHTPTKEELRKEERKHGRH